MWLNLCWDNDKTRKYLTNAAEMLQIPNLANLEI